MGLLICYFLEQPLGSLVANTYFLSSYYVPSNVLSCLNLCEYVNSNKISMKHFWLCTFVYWNSSNSYVMFGNINERCGSPLIILFITSLCLSLIFEMNDFMFLWTSATALLSFTDTEDTPGIQVYGILEYMQPHFLASLSLLFARQNSSRSLTQFYDCSVPGADHGFKENTQSWGSVPLEIRNHKYQVGPGCDGAMQHSPGQVTLLVSTWVVVLSLNLLYLLPFHILCGWPPIFFSLYRNFLQRSTW